MDIRHYIIDSELSGIKVTDEGFLKIPTRFSRVGIQNYSDGKGGTVREFRPAEEVFNDESMQTFVGKPVTFLHPTEEVTPENIKRYQVGTIISFKDENGEFTHGEIMITDKGAIEYINKRRDAGKDVQMSCGYRAGLEKAEGEFNGQKYDAIQRNIRGNHVAIVPKGRAGEQVKMRLDSQSEIEGESRMKLKLDSILNVESLTLDTDNLESVEEAINEREKMIKDAIEELKADMQKAKDELQAKLDSAEDEKKELLAKLDEANSQEFIDKLVAKRKVIHDAAEAVEAKIDGLEEAEAKKAVVKAVFDSCELDEKSEDYINARFDSALDVIELRKKEAALRAVNPSAKKQDEEEAPKSRQDAYDELNNRHNK